MRGAHPIARLRGLWLLLAATFLLAGTALVPAPASAQPTVEAGSDYVSRVNNRWLFFRANRGEMVTIRVHVPGGRANVTIYRDHFPGGTVVAYGSDFDGTGTTEVVFEAPRTTRYTVRVESTGMQGFTFSYLRPGDVQTASAGPAARQQGAPPGTQATVPPAAPPAAAPAVAAVAAPAILPAAAGPRVALVVGISAYGAIGDLANPVNDAGAVAAALREVGFDVELLLDPDQRTLRAAVSRLGGRMAAAGSGATGLFFFAGHGIQSRGVNYLIPARAAISHEADLVLEALPADAVLAQMQEAEASTNILILDACRNMPFTRSFRNAARGLAQMDAPNGSFIAYSTAPGSTAADGVGSNSPFATALVREITRPSQPIEVTFRNVRRSVLQETAGEQTPWDSSSLVEPFYFKAE